MEETLGKRIATCRKGLGMTQDRLAEQLGVTAQAVSKWENDQSCPDITMLPKLAELFGTSVDALLGVSQPKQECVHEAEVVTGTQPESQEKCNWDITWNAGRIGNVALAVWIILTAGWMFAARYFQLDVSMWDLLWTNGFLVFGLFRLLDKFSFFHLGCALFGAYSLAVKLDFLSSLTGRDLLLPACLLLFGLSLLVDALKKPRKPEFVVRRNGRFSDKKISTCDMGEDSFDCEVLFTETHQLVDLPVLREGKIIVQFGELTVDLSGCQEFAPNCCIDAECTFGEVTILGPRRARAVVTRDASFGSVDMDGTCDPDAESTVRILADVRFGQITIQYI